MAAIGCFLMKAVKMRIASMGYSSAFRLVCVLEVAAVSEKPRNKSTDKRQIKGNNTRKCLGNELRCHMHNFAWILQVFFLENYCRNCLKSEKNVNSSQSTYMIFVRDLFSPSALSSGESFVLLIRKLAGVFLV